jgi:hypothetical protein
MELDDPLMFFKYPGLAVLFLKLINLAIITKIKEPPTRKDSMCGGYLGF